MTGFQDLLAAPRVVATVHRPEDLAALPPGDGACDLLEFRLDQLAGFLDAAEAAAAACGIPCIITARHPAEGGAGGLASSDREALLRRFLPYAALVDVEVRSLAEMAGLIAEARGQGAGIIASCHDFQGPLPEPALSAAREAARDHGADALKIAARLETIADLAGLALFTASAVADGERVAAMGMGSLGKISRLLLAAAGSCLNYGYLAEPNAPGQWPAEELKRLIAEVA